MASKKGGPARGRHPNGRSQPQSLRRPRTRRNHHPPLRPYWLPDPTPPRNARDARHGRGCDCQPRGEEVSERHLARLPLRVDADIAERLGSDGSSGRACCGVVFHCEQRPGTKGDIFFAAFLRCGKGWRCFGRVGLLAGYASWVGRCGWSVPPLPQVRSNGLGLRAPDARAGFSITKD
jgi:hypothetical protein